MAHGDPFRDENRRDLRTKAFGAGALVALVLLIVGGFLYLNAGTEQAITGQIVRFGMYADDIGNRPLVLVRLPDGSEREIQTPRDVLLRCRVGDNISLTRNGSYLKITPDGCSKVTSAKP